MSRHAASERSGRSATAGPRPQGSEVRPQDSDDSGDAVGYDMEDVESGSEDRDANPHEFDGFIVPDDVDLDDDRE